MKNKFCIMITMSIAMLLPQTANAVDNVIPGKSLWGISLGMPRRQAVSILNSRTDGIHDKSTPWKYHTFKVHGYIDDTWNQSFGDNLEIFESLSKNGKVVQLRTWKSVDKGQTNLTFAQLNQKYHLSKSVYGFEDYVGYFYDDKKRGICYSLGVQDVFILTYKPDSITIHRQNSPVIPIMDGVYGKRQTGENAAAYANAGDARKAAEKRGR